jgi:hypothetical protein
MEPGGIGEALGVRHVNEEPQRFQLHGEKGLIKNGNFVKRMMRASAGARTTTGPFPKERAGRYTIKSPTPKN